jgi:hypothetical protein
MEDSFMDTIEESWLNLVDGAVEFVPRLLVALLLILVGMFLARYISLWIGKLVDFLENSKPVKTTLKELGAKQLDIDGVVTIFARWTILIIFLSAAVDVLGLPVLTDTFNALISFVPNILAAVVIAGLSFIAANVLHDVVHTAAKSAAISAVGFLAKATRVVVLIFGLPLAAAQLGLDLSIITNNVTVVVAGIMLAFGLAFGMGGREIATKILNDLYSGWKK